MKRFIILTFCLFAFFYSNSQAQDTLHVVADSLAYWSYNTTTYEGARNYSTGTKITGNVGRTGQWNEGASSWYVRRIGGFFNTSTIALTDTLVRAVLYFDVQCGDTTGAVCSPAWTNAHDSVCVCQGKYDNLDGSNWDQWTGTTGNPLGDSKAGCQYGTHFTIGLGQCDSIVIDSLYWITREGHTKLGLRTWQDIDSVSPPSNDPAYQISFNQTGDCDFYLKVWYYTPGIKPDSLLAHPGLNNGVVMDTVPYFMCRYNDTLDVADSIWWQVSTTPGDSNKWNSGWKNIANIEDGNMTDSVQYAGNLIYRNNWFYFRCKTKRADGGISGWSDVDSFKVIRTQKVYVTLMVDTESGDTNIDVYPILHETIDFSAFHSGGNVAEVMDYDWRESYKDPYGNLPCWNWCMIMGEPYDSASGSWDDHWEAGRCIYDTFTYYWQDTINYYEYNDIIGTHFHWYDWYGSYFYYGGGAPGQNDDMYDTLEMKQYMANFIWHGNDPSFLIVHRGGWNREHEPLHYFLKNWILFDWNNVDAGHASWINPYSPREDTMFRPYNPSDTNWCVDADVHQDRWIDGIGYVTSGYYDNAWDQALSEDYAVFAIYDHNYDESGDMKSHFETAYSNMVDEMNRAGVAFVFCNVQQAMRWSHGWTDSVAPTFTITQIDDSVKVELSETILNPSPFGITLNTSVEPDTFCFIDFNQHSSTVWYYSVNDFPGKAKFAVIDTCGNAALDSITTLEVEELNIRRRRIMQNIQIGEIENEKTLFGWFVSDFACISKLGIWDCKQ